MTDSVSPFDKQIANRNYMSPVGFKLILTKTPKVDFLCQSANIPQISMGTAIQPTYLKDIPVPGDKVLYDDLNVRFLVDEKMENYLAIYKWITGLGFPESLGQFDQLKKDDLNMSYNLATTRQLQLIQHLLLKTKDLNIIKCNVYINDEIIL